MLATTIDCTFGSDKDFSVEFIKSNNKVYVSENSNITDFKKFKFLCEQMELQGYKLNIAEGCYER